MPNEFVIKNGLINKGSAFVEGNITSSGNISASGNIVAQSFTGSFSGSINDAVTSSFALTSSKILGGSSNFVTRWLDSTTLTSSLIRDNGTTIAINTTPITNSLVRNFITFTENSNTEFYNIIATTTFTGTGSGLRQSFRSNPVINNDGTQNVVSDFVAFPFKTGTGSVTTIRNFWAGGNTASGSIGTRIAYWVGDFTKTGTATISTEIGLDVLDLTGTTSYGVRSALLAGANKWNLYVNGTANNYIAGNVGVGTTNPSNILTIVGAASIGSTTYNTTAPTNGLIVEGNVGIGTTNPSAKLHIRDDSITPTLIIENRGLTTNPYILFIPTASNASFAVGIDDGDDDKFKISYGANNNAVLSSNVYFTISSSGNIGIGTTNPVNDLTVADPTGATVAITTGRVNGSSASPLYPTLDFLGFLNSNKARIRASEESFNTNGSSLQFFVNNGDSMSSLVEYARITRFGNVGIGTTNPVNRLDVAGNISASVITASNLLSNALTSSNVLVNGNITVAGSIFASVFSSSVVYVTSSQLIIGDNIITLNALSPYQRYSGIEMYDSGSGTLSSLLWDSQNDYFFVSGSGINNKLIIGPDNQSNLTNNYIPKVTDGFKLGNSIIFDNGTNVGIGISTPTNRLDVVGNISASTITASLLGTSSWATNSISANTSSILQNARLINGTSFNGSADITTDTWGTSRNVTIGNTTRSVNGSANVTWSLSDIGAQAALTNPVTGTGASGQISYWSGTTTQTGNNNLFWDNTNVRLGIGTSSPSATIESRGSCIFRNSTNSIAVNVGPIDSGNTGNASSINLYSGDNKYWHNVVRGDSHPTNPNWWNLFYFNSSSFITAIAISSSTAIGFGANPVDGYRTYTLGNVGISQNLDLLGSSGTLTFSGSSGAKTIRTANNTNLVIDTGAGNIGIGTTNPLAELHINANGDDWLRLTSGSIDWRFREQGARLKISSGSTDVVTFRTTGDVGIGTTNPNNRLTVIGAASIGSTTYNTTAPTNGLIVEGSIGIGTTNPVNKLDVVGNISCSAITASSFFGTSSWSTNTLTASSLVTSNNYQVSNFTASNISASGTGSFNIVGIGITNPTALLQLSSSTASTLFSVAGSGGASIINVSGSGNIGIGTSPVSSYRLQVNGAFAASTKSFVIDHPTKPNKKLVYGSLESPYHGIRLTGRQKTKNGKATIILPEYINKLVREETVNIQLTPIKSNKVLFIDSIDISNNKFVVAFTKTKKSSNIEVEFFWDFTAVRSDVDELITEI